MTGTSRAPQPGALNVMLFGATGMVGQGVLRECLNDPGVSRVLAVGRTALGRQHPKLQELIVSDLYDLRAVEPQLTGFDACFFTLGPSAAGMSEQAYAHVTYDLTIGIAETLARLDPDMTFVYVSGAGTDSSERGRVMWARVKGRTENALLRLPFRRAYMFRPGVIQPLHGIRSKTRLYRLMYAMTGPVFPALKSLFPDALTTTEQVGRAMLAVARRGYDEPILDPRDINSL